MRRAASPRLRRLLLAAGWCGVTGAAFAQPATLSPSADGGQEHAERAVRMGSGGTLDLNVRNTEVAAVLEMLSHQAKLNIVASSNVKGEVSANLFSVPVEEALSAVLIPNGYQFIRRGSTIFVGTPEEVARQMPAPQTRVMRLTHISRQEAAGALTALLGDHGKVSVGGAAGASAGGSSGASGPSSDTDELGHDYVLVTANAERLAQAEMLLREIDVPPRQVLIEATILRATLNEDDEFGIDFTLLGGVDFENVSSISNAGSDLQTGLLPSGELQDTTINVNTGFAGNVTPGGFSFGIIRNELGVFLRALETVTDVTVVANPKVVALNKREAEVIVGRRDGYLTTTVTETAAVQTVEFLETGTQIKIRPIIGPDGTVRMWVHPKDSNGGLTAANLPFEETTEAKAEVVVRDGHTILIGGLFRERTLASRSQIPVLGNLPLAGALFRSHADATIREEVIVLLTVHVLRGSPEESEQFDHLLDDVERTRVGARLGLNGIGRERLAQAFYQEALRKADEGDAGLALLNVRLALSNQPRMLSALRLKEQLLAQRLWQNDGGRMRSFVRYLIRDFDQREQRRVVAPVFGRPESDRDGAPRGAASSQDGSLPVDHDPVSDAPTGLPGADPQDPQRAPRAQDGTP